MRTRKPFPKCEICEKTLSTLKGKRCVEHYDKTYNRGKKRTEEQKNKLSDAHKGKMKGEKHPRWKGGYQRILHQNNQRRIMRLENGGSHTLGEWETLKAQYNWTCPSCERFEPDIILTRDHIIPLSRGGSDNIENIQPLCGSCNSRKKDKTIKY